MIKCSLYRRFLFACLGLPLVCLPACVGGVGPGGIATSSSETERALRKPVQPVAVQPETDGTIDRIMINGQPITIADVLDPLRDELDKRSKQNSPQVFQKFVVDAVGNTLRDRVTDALLYSEASRRMAKEEREALQGVIDTELRKRITQQFGGIQRNLENKLADQGRTLDDYRKDLEKEIMIYRYLELTLKPKVPQPTRPELKELFDELLSQWNETGRREMSLIDVQVAAQLPRRVRKPTDEQRAAAKAAARRKIEVAASALRAGKSFGEVAKEYSNGVYAAVGGAWGEVMREGLADRYQPVVAELFTMAEGEVSDIIETGDAFFIVRCDKLVISEKPTFVKMQQRLKDRLFAQRYNNIVNEHIQELRDTARIEPVLPKVEVDGKMKQLDTLQVFYQSILQAAVKAVGEASSGSP